MAPRHPLIDDQRQNQLGRRWWKLKLCAAGCKLPPTCGDGIVQAPFELCDNGAANSDTAYGGCATTCDWGPYCGDGHVDPGEECDDGPGNVAADQAGRCGYDCRPAYTLL